VDELPNLSVNAIGELDGTLTLEFLLRFGEQPVDFI
jgi:hypothetical protein